MPKISSCDANTHNVSSLILSVNYHPQDPVTDRADMQQVARTPPRECVGRTALDQCSQKGAGPWGIPIFLVTGYVLHVTGGRLRKSHVTGGQGRLQGDFWTM